MVTITFALLRAYLLSDVENDGGDEGDGGQEGHGGEEGHGDDPPLERYTAAVDALRPDGYTKVRYKTVSIDAMRHWKTCYDELRRTRTRARSQLTAIMDGSTSRKGADGQTTTTKITGPIVRGCCIHTAQR